jgi:endonuclease G, mitochondrial
MLCLALAVFAISGCQSLHDQFREPPPKQDHVAPAPRDTVRSDHLPFGNPSTATADPGNEDNFLMVGEGSVISYNNARGTANWAAWRTTRDDLADSIRRPDFRSDPRLPRWYKRIGPFDYAGSGYDRGHLVPSADRFANPRLNVETFMMTNIVPQSRSLNQYPWNDFEQYVRAQVRKGFDAYQIAGVYGEAGRIKGKISAPTNCWKVVVLLPRGAEPASINERARVLAIDVPNENGLEHEKWMRFRTSAKAIEQRTGLDLFSSLPLDLQRELETRTETVSR